VVNEDGIVKLDYVKDEEGSSVKYVGNPYQILTEKQIMQFRAKEK
jgi:hypothetical protein